MARKLNVGRSTIVDFLSTNGFEVDSSPNSKITGEQYAMLAKEFAASASEKEEASHLTIGTKLAENLSATTTDRPKSPAPKEEDQEILIKNLTTEKVAPAEETPAAKPEEPSTEPPTPSKEEEKKEEEQRSNLPSFRA